MTEKTEIANRNASCDMTNIYLQDNPLLFHCWGSSLLSRCFPAVSAGFAASEDMSWWLDSAALQGLDRFRPSYRIFTGI